MSETHNGACNHGSTGYCRTCSEESQDAIAELHRLRSPDWITRQQDRDAEIVKLRTERDTLLTAAVIDTATILRRDEELQMLRAEREAARELLERCVSVFRTPGMMMPSLADEIDAALKEAK